MGQLLGRQIIQSRIWYNEEVTPPPSLDYDYAYPITVYDAVHRDMEDNSPTLTDEIGAIYRLLSEKQPIIEAGIAGRLMNWTGVRGQIGDTEVVKRIATYKINQSHGKIPTERAVGDALATKTPLELFTAHSTDTDLHVSEDEKILWNSMAPMSTVEAHIQNKHLHVTEVDKAKWDAKADAEDLKNHRYDTNNPHNVTAHQAGTYTRQEIDKMFEDIRDTFFHYVNIYWDNRMNSASLVEYEEINWNPNFVLDYGATLPDVDDPTATYFALIPATDYSTNETQDCLIYVKLPGLTWQEVGLQHMQPGDMVIRYPQTTMHVWVQGRFMELFKQGDGPSNPGTPSVGSNTLWKPVMGDNGELGWTLATADDPPETMVIKGYTPIKGVDYFDGKDGQGVPLGGRTHELLAKSSDEDNDTEWKDFFQVLTDFMADGGVMPKDIVIWDHIKDRPERYTGLGENEDGYVTQKGVTEAIRDIDIKVDEIKMLIDGLGDVEGFQSNLHEHLNDFNNPHRVSVAQIGAVSIAQFLAHSQNFENPHLLTAEQLGLGNVNNTSDKDKPISDQTQAAIDDLLKKIEALSKPGTTAEKYVTDIVWNPDDSTITVTFNDDTTFQIVIPKNENTKPVFAQIYYDHATKELVIVDKDTGAEDRIPLEEFIQTFTGSEGATIDIVIDSNDRICAILKANSVTGEQLVEHIHLRGHPTVDTQDVTDNSTRIANTEWVRGQVIDNLISYEVDRPLSANMGRILNETKANVVDILELIEDLEGIDIIDNLDSTSEVSALSANMGRYLNLTKAPRVHTSPSGSTFGRATGEVFGHVRASTFDPVMDGTVDLGEDDGTYARGLHRHPTDKTRAPVHWPDVVNGITKFTGEPRAPLAPDNSNDDQLATTEWVRRNAVGVCKGVCRSEANDPVKVVDLQSTYMDPVAFTLQIGTPVSVTFSNADKSGDQVTKLNVQGSGEFPILFAGVTLKNGMIGKNHEHLFVFDGSNWKLINVVPGTGIGAGSGGISFGPGADNKDDDEHEHVDNDHDGFCDICGEKTHECLDTDGDGKCDICGDDMHECVDNDDDGICDICGKPMFGFPDDDDYGQIRNEHAGYHGITCPGDGKVDIHGQVKRAWVAISYTPRAADVEVTISKHKNAWALRMGDGSIVRCRTPQIIETTRSSCIIQFTLETYYPANSLCTLLYHTNKAWLNIEEIDHHHKDENMDGKCDICGKVMPGHTHVDGNGDGRCDVCGNIMPNHVHYDRNNDGKCDLCGKDMPPDHEHVDDDGDGICDTCGAEVPECVDNNNDGKCDICGKPMFGFPDDENYGEIRNEVTGYQGMTYPGTGPIDTNGQVKRVMIPITFTPRQTAVKVTMSKHKNAWALRMGDGTVMRCRNPKIGNVTKSSCIVELTMENYYPANSPCMLLYHTNRAWFNIEEI